MARQGQPCYSEDLAWAHGAPETRAMVKQNCSDFRVDEELGFEPSGSGEHLMLHVQKVDLSTTEVARRLALTLDVNPAKVGFAGMKDRRAECRQWFSVPATNAEGALARVECDQISILSSARNRRKLHIGCHKANRFQLALRHCHGGAAAFERRLRTIASHGVPNYFGKQRFGRDMTNLHQVTELMRESLEQQAMLPRLGRSKRSMLLSAARAYLFNQILSERVSRADWERYLPGDVLNLDGSDRCFDVAPRQWDAALEDRLLQMDIHPTGLLAGAVQVQQKYLPWGETADIEESIVGKFQQLQRGLELYGLKAARRALRCRISDLEWAWEPQDTLRLRFTLRKGAYATSMLRELCQEETVLVDRDSSE